MCAWSVDILLFSWILHKIKYRGFSCFYSFNEFIKSAIYSFGVSNHTVLKTRRTEYFPYFTIANGHTCSKGLISEDWFFHKICSIPFGTCHSQILFPEWHKALSWWINFKWSNCSLLSLTTANSSNVILGYINSRIDLLFENWANEDSYEKWHYAKFPRVYSLSQFTLLNANWFKNGLFSGCSVILNNLLLCSYFRYTSYHTCCMVKISFFNYPSYRSNFLTAQFNFKEIKWDFNH